MADRPSLEEPLTGTILVVDDSVDSSAVLVDQLNLEGFTATAVHDGPSALDLIRSAPPDLVLLDVRMPGMDGMEVLGTIRANIPTTDLPVIMLTALDDPQDVVHGLELGANDYVTKPPQFEVLVARVRTQIKIKRLQDQRRLDLARLRELDALKDKFIQIAAHDLKSPINNVTLGIGVLSRVVDELKKIDGSFGEVLEVMGTSATMMSTIVNDFLDFQAIQAGHIKLEKRPAQLNAIVEAVIGQFKPYAASKSISLQPDLAADLPDCVADPDRLAQVASNLLGNAIKFSPKNGTVVVRTRLKDNRWRVEVEDRGPGIPPEEMPLLFREFAHLSNKPTGGEKSSGLGLAIARHLVELHGGQIGAESTPGKGSTFWFEIPQ